MYIYIYNSIYIIVYIHLYFIIYRVNVGYLWGVYGVYIEYIYKYRERESMYRGTEVVVIPAPCVGWGMGVGVPISLWDPCSPLNAHPGGPWVSRPRPLASD